MEPGGDDFGFLCSLVYGPFVWRENEGFWQELRQLEQNDSLPWVCMGDFNDIVQHDEKQGARYSSIIFMGLTTVYVNHRLYGPEI